MPSSGVVQPHKSFKTGLFTWLTQTFFALLYSKVNGRTQYQVRLHSVNMQVYFPLGMSSLIQFFHCKFILFSLSMIQKQESLSALTTLMQEPSSPEPKKPAVTENNSKEYAQLVSYSIVIDVKSTVWRRRFWITRSALTLCTNCEGLLKLQHCLWFQCIFYMSLELDVRGSSVDVVKYQFFLRDF